MTSGVDPRGVLLSMFVCGMYVVLPNVCVVNAASHPPSRVSPFRLGVRVAEFPIPNPLSVPNTLYVPAATLIACGVPASRLATSRAFWMLRYGEAIVPSPVAS